MSNTERCEFCRHSERRDKESMKCNLTFINGSKFKRVMIVQRFDSCEKFVREPGADDE